MVIPDSKFKKLHKTPKWTHLYNEIYTIDDDLIIIDNTLFTLYMLTVNYLLVNKEKSIVRPFRADYDPVTNMSQSHQSPLWSKLFNSMKKLEFSVSSTTKIVLRKQQIHCPNSCPSLYEDVWTSQADWKSLYQYSYAQIHATIWREKKTLENSSSLISGDHKLGINWCYLTISTCSIAPEKEKKSYTSFSVAFGDRPVISMAYPPGFMFFRNLSGLEKLSLAWIKQIKKFKTKKQTYYCKYTTICRNKHIWITHGLT